MTAAPEQAQIVLCNDTLDEECCAVLANPMEIESITHKALRIFAETGKSKGLIKVERLSRMLNYLADAGSMT